MKKILVTTILSTLSVSAFAGVSDIGSAGAGTNVAGYNCEVTSVRNSLKQLVYDYSVEIDSNYNRPSIDIPWLKKGDKFVLNVDPTKASDEKVETLFTVKENSCDGSGNIVENSNPNIVGKYSVNIDPNLNKNELRGKMGLIMMGKFSSETCEDVFPNVIVKFSCVKQGQ